MQTFHGHKHDAPTAVDEIIFERDRTVIVCVDGEKYGMETVTFDGKRLTQAVQIEMYPSTTSIENKAYCN